MAKYFSYSTNDDDFFIFDTLEQAKQATLEKARDLYENFGYDGFLDDEQIGWIEDCFYGEVLGKIHIPKDNLKIAKNRISKRRMTWNISLISLFWLRRNNG
ncbi:hypothetical protein A1D19_00190 [Lonepinella koalarum]|uniref:hypothetical protein n=1 Tax=Lonepinella koalarum TaxID=53417 RepID=UPI00244C6BE6|nr:hypothetical protein [Lonepinella koalarum]MDH2925593.1 hypothetical protein [Lonepinella koalarum]